MKHIDTLQTELDKFSERTADIAKLEKVVETQGRTLEALQNDTLTEPAELRKMIAKVRQRISDAEVEIGLHKARLPNAAHALLPTYRDAKDEHIQASMEASQARRDEVAALMNGSQMQAALVEVLAVWNVYGRDWDSFLQELGLKWAPNALLDGADKYSADLTQPLPDSLVINAAERVLAEYPVEVQRVEPGTVEFDEDDDGAAA